MSIVDKLEQVSKQEPPKPWKGTFRDFLNLFETEEFKNLGVLSHKRVYNMVLSQGTTKDDYYGKKRESYNFFEDRFFGMRETIDQIMSYCFSAAQRTETSRRMLLLYGPPSSGKSDLIASLKKGLEKYTVGDAGAVFALEGSDMHENPLLLVPYDLRKEFEQTYNVPIEGELSPTSRYRLEHEFNGDFMKYPIERIFFSEAKRVGIGTWLPSDPKCITGDCLVLTEHGLQRGKTLFRELIENKSKSMHKKAYGTSGQVNIKNCHDNGCRPVFNVNARGLTIKATNNHRFLTVDSDGTFKHQYVKNIVGKSILVKVGTEVFGSHGVLKRLSDHAYTSQHDECDLPALLTPSMSRLTGYLVADGHCDNSQIDFSNQDNSLNVDVQSIIADTFLIESAIYKRGGSTNAYIDAVDLKQVLIEEDVEQGIVISKQRFVDFMNLNFSLNNVACEKKVPDVILSASKENQLEFLEGLYLVDGYAIVHGKTANISFGSYSLQLVQEIQVMLLNLGVFGGISSYQNKEYSKNIKYELICEGEDALALAELLPRFMKNRGVDFSEASSDGKFNYESFGDLSGLIADIRESIDLRYMIFANSVNVKSTSRQSLIRWKRHLDSDECNWIKPENKESIVGRINSLLSYRCIPVVSAEYVGMEQVYDLEVDHEDHVFVVNGMVSHNSQDVSELLGSVDMAKIQKVGSESDPNAYNFDGEFFAANRGIMEYIEGLKADERFLRCNLTATQEKCVKAPRFGLLYLDTFIVMHTNEEEFRGFMNEKKYEAYHDRIITVPTPYCTEVSSEVKIYEKLLSGTDVSDMHIAPHTLKTAAMFAVLSRLEPPMEGEDMTLIQKMKLYDNNQVKGHKIEEVIDIKKKYSREGMSGASPRFVIDQIVAAISKAKVEGRDFVTSLDILRQLNNGVNAKETLTAENKTAFKSHLSSSREEWNDLLSRDIQQAFYVSFKEEARNLVENYIDQIEASASGTTLRDPTTDEEVDPDEALMESIEDHIGITNHGRESFRNEILRMVGHVSRKNKSFDYTSHATLREAIEKQLFHERKNVIRMTTTTRNPDQEQLKKINEVVERLTEKDLGYTASSANELLKYASAHLFDK